MRGVGFVKKSIYMRTISFVIICVLFLLSFLIPGQNTVSAATVVLPPEEPGCLYVTPNGDGNMDGTSWANALSGNQAGALQAAWDTLASDKTLYIGSGTYYVPQTLNITSGGTTHNLTKKLVGVDTGAGLPVFEGSWTPGVLEERSFIHVSSGISYWWIKDIKIKKYSTGIYTEGRNNGYRIYNVDISEMKDGLCLLGGASETDTSTGSNDITIKDCDFTNYSMTGMRMKGGNYFVRVAYCTADAGGKAFWQNGNIPVGFQIGDAGQAETIWDRGIVFTNCTSKNNYHDNGDQGYWDGDGFAAERQAYDISYIQCNAFDNTDGGWDDKSRNPTLVDCVSMRNKKNFSFTSSGTAVLTRCLGAYSKLHGGIGSSVGVWAGGYDGQSNTPSGNVEVYHSTFHNNLDYQVQVDGGFLRIFDSILSTTDTNGELSKVGLSDSSFYGIFNTAEFIAGMQGRDPLYVNGTNLDWDGQGKDFNNQLYGTTKGYYYIGTAEEPVTIDAVKTGSTYHAAPNSGDRYVTPQGAGRMDGTDWDNAMCGDKIGGLQAAWDEMSSSGTLYVGSGTYTMVQSLILSTGGESIAKPKRVVGIDTGAGLPEFVGPWTIETQYNNPAPPQTNFIDLPDNGVNNVWIEGLRIRNYYHPIFVYEQHKGIRIYNIEASNVRAGINIEGTGKDVPTTIGASDILIKDCILTKYKHRGIRFRYGISNARIINVSADAGGQAQWFQGNFPMSFSIGDKSNYAKDTGFVFIDCVGRDNYHQDADNKYWNSDSWSCEGEASDTVYYRCKAFDNTDGGWDDKSQNPTYIDCVSTRNKRGFRMWNDHTAFYLRTISAFNFKRGGSGGDLAIWMNGTGTTSLEAYNSTFMHSGEVVSHENSPYSGTLRLFDCIVATTSSSSNLYNNPQSVRTFNTAEYKQGVSGVDPQFVNPDSQWNGEGKNMDSLLYGKTKGYYYIGSSITQTIKTSLEPLFVNIAGSKRIKVPQRDNETKKVTFTANVLDQFGKPITGQIINWTVYGAPVGVSIDQNGILSIPGDAVPDSTFKVIAKGGTGSEVFGNITITLQPRINMTLGTPVFKNLKGESVSNLQPFEGVQTAINITNTEDIDLEAELIIALYDKNGNLVNLGSTKGQIDAGQSKELNVAIGLPAIIDGHYIEVFVVDSFENMLPLSDRARFLN